MTILELWCMVRTASFKRHLGQTGRAFLPTQALRRILRVLDIGHR